MKPLTIPIICCTALAMMLAAGFIEWSSVRHSTALAKAGLLHLTPQGKPISVPGIKTIAPEAIAQVAAPSPPSPVSLIDPSQKQFFEMLTKEIKTLKAEAQNLQDQVAETNRDLMNANFRLDGFSSQFRPLPVSDELRTLKTGEGMDLKPLSTDSWEEHNGEVLPPRAEPVFLPDEDLPAN
jgi:cytochrome c-type biogenesis protein CcmH/NrfF